MAARPPLGGFSALGPGQLHPRWGQRLHLQHDLAEMRVRPHVGVRGRRLVERERTIDQQVQRAIGNDPGRLIEELRKEVYAKSAVGK